MAEDLAGHDKVNGGFAKGVRAQLGKLEDKPQARAFFGYILGGLSLLGFVGVAILVFAHLEGLLALKDLSDRVFITYVVGHAVATVAIVWFLYQLLKVSERMTLPSYYVDQVISSEPSFLRALLGVEDPTAGVKNLTAPVAALVKAAAELTKAGEKPEQ